MIQQLSPLSEVLLEKLLVAQTHNILTYLSFMKVMTSSQFSHQPGIGCDFEPVEFSPHNREQKF
jgi:hypothetical protein